MADIYGIFFNNGIRTGGQRRYLRLLEKLAGKGCRVTLFCNREVDPALKDVRTVAVGVPYVYHKTKGLSGLFARNLKAFLKSGDGRRILQEARIRAENAWILIHGETHWDAAKVLSETARIPVAFAQRSDSFTESVMYLKYERLSPKQKAFHIAYMLRQIMREREIARKAGIVFFQSDADRTSFLKRAGHADAKTAVIRGDINQKNFKLEYARTNRSQTCRNLLFLGTLGARKGIRYLLEAAARLKADGTAFTLRVFGSGSKRDTEDAQAFIREHGLSGCVALLGSTDEPLEEMRRADLFVVPSLFDSYPDTVIEAIHCGLPVVAARVGGIPDMLRHDELLFPPADSESLYALLKRLITDKTAYEKTRSLCAARREYFDFDWAQAWLDAMERTKRGRTEGNGV